MKNKFFISLLAIALMCSAIFAQTNTNVDKILLLNTKDTPIKVQLNINDMQIQPDGTVVIPSLNNVFYTIKTSYIEKELITERIKYLNEKESVIVLQLTSSSPKVYDLLFIYNLLSVEDYKKATNNTEKSKQIVTDKKENTKPGIAKTESKKTVNKFDLANKYHDEYKYIHALSLYYDVMSTPSDKNSTNAKWAWDSLLYLITHGSSPDSSFDDFEIYEYWYNLLNEFEDLWFEECPVTLTIKDLKKGNIDLEAGTANYNFSLESNWTNKYLEIYNALNKGVTAARQDSWKQIPTDWPKYSCRGEKSLPDKNRYFSAGSFYSDQKKYVSYATFNKKEFGIIYSIYTLDGTEICTNQTAFAGNSTNTIKGIDRKLAKHIDNGQVTFKIDKIVTRMTPYQYNYVKAGYIIPYWTSPIQNPSDFVTKDVFNYEHFIVNNPFDLPAVDYVTLYDIIDLEMAYIPEKKLLMYNSEVSQKLYSLVTHTNPSYKEYTYEIEKYPIDKISIYDAICFCNRISDIYQLTPVYSVNGETDISKWPVKPFTTSLKTWPDDAKITIKQNAKADGFRLPTVDEWRYAANKRKDYVYKSKTDFEKSAVTSISRYEKSPSKCKSKTPNEYSLYDMFGNVWEIAITSMKDEITLYKDPNFNKWTGESSSYRVTYLGGSYNSLFYTNNFDDDCSYNDLFYFVSEGTGFRFVRNWEETEWDEGYQ